MLLPDSVHTLEADLRAVFGSRLQSLIAYPPASRAPGTPLATLAIVDGLAPEDLRACAARVAGWHDDGLDTPLLLAAEEFERSLDAFPFEFGAILAEHTVVAGADPFAGLRVDPAHMRHACEVRARSHLLHVRENYLETRGRGDAIADLLLQSAPGFSALIFSVARLHGQVDGDAEAAARAVETAAGIPAGAAQAVVRLTNASSLTPDAARGLMPAYIDALQRLTAYIDRWSAS